MPRDQRSQPWPSFTLATPWSPAGWLAALGLALVALLPAHADDLDQQRSRLATLSAEDKAELLRKKERFDRLPAEEQQRLRQLHAQLQSAPDASRLESVLERYSEWLTTLASGQRADLLSLPPEERLAAIKRIKEEQARELLRRLVATRITADDAKTIFAWMGETLKRHEAEIVATMPEVARADYQRLDDEARRRRMLFQLMFNARSNSGPTVPSGEDVALLIPQLSEEPRKALLQLSDVDQRRHLVQQWLGAAMANRLAPPAVSAEELEKFYDEHLDARTRSYLESLPPEQRNEELRRAYFTHRWRRGGWDNKRPGALPWGVGPGTGGANPGGQGSGGREGPGRGSDSRGGDARDKDGRDGGRRGGDDGPSRSPMRRPPGAPPPATELAPPSGDSPQ